MRESYALEDAMAAYDEAITHIAAYDELPEAARQETAGRRKELEAEQRLVEAILNAHKRELLENMAHFEQAYAAANKVSQTMVGRVYCCFGSVLIFEGCHDDAVRFLERACAAFKEEESHDEYVQAMYHLGRAHMAKGDKQTARQILESIVPDPDRYDRRATRHHLAAILLLARFHWRSRRFAQAWHLHRHASDLARANALYAAPEYRAISFIRRWGFLPYVLIPDRRDLPLI